MRGFKAIMLVSAFAGAQPAEALAQDDVTIDRRGIAHCDGGDNIASSGKKPTPFANEYWSLMGCGKFDAAKEVLEHAPKADPREPLPAARDMFDSTLAECYYKSFSYDFSYHARSVDPFDGTKVVDHGWYEFPEETFSKIERAALEACKPKIS